LYEEEENDDEDDDDDDEEEEENDEEEEEDSYARNVRFRGNQIEKMGHCCSRILRMDQRNHSIFIQSSFKLFKISFDSFLIMNILPTFPRQS
jgi:hypothetical protein